MFDLRLPAAVQEQTGTMRSQMYLCCLQTLLTRSSHSRMIYSQLLVPNFHPACVMQRQVITHASDGAGGQAS